MNAEASANAWVFSFLQILTLHYALAIKECVG